MRKLLFILTFTIACCLLPIACFSQEIEIDPGAIPLDDEQLAAQYYQDKDFDKAAVLYEKLYNKNQNASYYSNYLNSLLELKDFDKAEKLIRKRMKLEPNALKYKVDLGYLYVRADKNPKADKEFESALKDLNGDYQQTSELANAFLNRNLNDYALKTYAKARKNLRNNNLFNFEVAYIYDRIGDYQSMIDEYLNLAESNPSFVETVENILQMLFTNDLNSKKIDLLRKSLIKRIQQNSNVTIYPEMLLWLSIQQKDFQSAFEQSKSLDRLYKENGNRLYNFAKLCTSNKEYKLAADVYQYVINKGADNPFYEISNIELLNVKYLILINSIKVSKDEITELESKIKFFLNQYGKNNRTVELIKILGHIEAFYLDKNKEASDLLNEGLALKDITREMRAALKMELADILVAGGDVWEATLLYSQVEKEFKNDTIGASAKFKNARLFYYIGEFKWAKAELGILRAATSKLIANDAMHLYLLINDNTDLIDSNEAPLKLYSKADLYSFQNKDDLAMLCLDSIFKLFPNHNITDRAIYKEGEIDLKKGLYREADSLFTLIVLKYPEGLVADDAIMNSAKVKEVYCNCKDKAMQLYEKLFKDYPTSIYVSEARKRFRELRGDILN